MGRGDINAIERIIEACECSKDDAVEVINHLLGATKHHEFVGSFVTDLTVSPELIAKLLRAARGERIELGRLSFGGDKPLLAKAADELTRCARSLRDVFQSGSSLRAQVGAALQSQNEKHHALLLVHGERRHHVESALEALRSGDADEAAHQLATLLASWEA